MRITKDVSAIVFLAAIVFPFASFARRSPHRARRPRQRVMRFVATADAVREATAKGTVTHRGIVAADPRILPLGSLVRVGGAGRYSGTYAVTDTGGKISGRKIDIFVPSVREARRFGRRRVTVCLLHRGDNRKNHREVTPRHVLVRRR